MNPGFASGHVARSRLTKIETADGAITRITYDDRFDKPATVTDALGQSTHYRYDARGLPTEITDARGGAKQLAYNNAGQSTAYRYDAAGRLTAASYPDGASETYEYDALGRLTGHTDAGGKRTAYALDAEGRLRERTNALGGKLEYNYDGAKRLAHLVNENGAVYAFNYDLLDRLVQETGFDTRTTRYRYDAAGRPTAKVELGQANAADAADNTIETKYQRDAAGRLAEKTITATGNPDATAPHTTRYQYDALGRLTEAANHDATVQLRYDAIGQLLSEKSTTGESVSLLRHLYDPLGNRIQTILPDGRKLQHLFYGSGHLHQISLDGETVSDMERDAKHCETSHTQGALTSQFQYDPVGRLSAQLARLDPARAGSVGNLSQQRSTLQAIGDAPGPQAGGNNSGNVINRQYEYDKTGNLTSLTDQRFGRTTYGYDAIGRIMSAAQPNLSETFAFDLAHNLIDQSIGGSGGLLENNQITVFEDKRYAYDAHGNLTDKKIGSHTHIKLDWNAEHQLEQSQVTRNAQDDDPVVQRTVYKYDPFGRRIQKRDAFGETNFTWDGNRLLAETRGSHTRTYLYEGNSFVPLAQVDSGAPPQPSDPAKNSAQVLYFHTDHLGTPRELTDSGGNLHWVATYKAWGNVLGVEMPQVGTEAQTINQVQALRFQGQYFDVESGLYYNRFRYYDPDIGRFVSQDPIGLKGGNNLYQYAPNPCGWIDPLGLAGNPATATHITYQGIDAVTMKPYVGYASMQGNQTAADVLNYRYGGDFSRFGGNAPDILYSGYGQGGKDVARGLEQRTFENLGGLKGTANRQNPVGEGNARRDIYLDAADKHRAGSACSC